MRTVRKSIALTALLLSTAGVLPAGHASAREPGALPADAKRVILSLERTGKLTNADRAVLRKYPEVAAITRDPAKSTVEVTEETVEPISAEEAASLGLTASAEALTSSATEALTTSATSTAVVAAAAYCASVTVTKREASTLGATLYRFNHALRWCYTLNGTVHEVPVRTHYLTDVSFTVEWKGLTSNVFYGLRTSQVSSYLQGHFQHCYPSLGCVGNSYPSVNIIARSNGTYSYSTAG